MSATLSSLSGKFKCSKFECFNCPDGIIPDSGLTGLKNIYIYIYIYKQDLGLNQLQGLICNKT